MTDSRNGHCFGIPHSRRLSWDLLHFNHQIPLCAHDRRMNVSDLANARRMCPVRISWPALFLKAYGCVAAEIPELRQTWYRWPWAHLYQHPVSIGILTVQRQFKGEPWLFWGNVGCPESQSLEQIQQRIDVFRDASVPETFGRQLQLAKLPTVLRRMIWWWNLNLATQKRARRLGTFFLSTLAGKGVEIQVPPSVQTGCLTFGPLDAAQCSKVTLAYDHRVMDGVLVAEVLQQLEQTLNQRMVDELSQLKARSETCSAVNAA